MNVTQVLQNFFVNDLFEKAIANFDIEKYDDEQTLQYEEKRFEDAQVSITFYGERKDDFNTTITLQDISVKCLLSQKEIFWIRINAERTINNNFLNRLNFK